MIVIENAEIYTPHEVIYGGTVVVEDGHISAVHTTPPSHPFPAAVEVIDATGLLLVPGFIDLQLNGGFGHDFTADPEAIWSVAARLPQYGVTAFLPTIITAPPETIRGGQAVMAAGPPPDFVGATPLGLHLEGPFLHPEKRGAHNPAYLRAPDPEMVDNWGRETAVFLVTLAPELHGALDLVRLLTERGVVVAAGHSTASYAAARAGFEAGIHYGTHLFNAMPPLGHREPGLVGALLSDQRVTIGLIADGVHVHPQMVDLVWRLAGSRLTLVSDAMAALGRPPGVYQLGDRAVTVEGGEARLADGALAGSVLAPDQALRNLMAYTGAPLQAVLPALTTRPAELLALSRQGRISSGYLADLILLTNDFRVASTMKYGAITYRAVQEHPRL